LIEEGLMRGNFLGYAMASAILAGCSSSPSDGDVKQIVEGMLGGCRYLSLEKFKKVNGIAAGEGRYAVDVVFAVKVAPVPIAKELVEKGKADSVAINEKLAAAMAAKAQAAATEGDYDAKIVKASESRDSALATSLLTEKVNFANGTRQLEREITLLQGQKRAIDSATLSPIHDKINQDCPHVHDMIRVYEPNNLDQYTGTFIKDFGGTLPLVKTDNGWRAVL
jgi:hypothetical protein